MLLGQTDRSKVSEGAGRGPGGLGRRGGVIRDVVTMDSRSCTQRQPRLRMRSVVEYRP